MRPMFKSDKLCPYCLEALKEKDIMHCCPSCGEEVEPTKMERLLGEIPKCKNPKCHRHNASLTKHRLCKLEIPPDIMDFKKYLRFCLLGTTGAGKSNFLITMLHELIRAQDSPWILSALNKKTLEEYTKNDKLVYIDGKPVPRTPPGTPPVPQQWRIRDRSRMTGNTIPTYSLTIFDGAGEDCKNIKPEISRYIADSKVLVILIDPLALHGVRSTVDPGILNASTTAEQSENASAALVDGLADYIRSNSHIKPGKLIDRDVAVVFTKIDAVKDSFGVATVTMPSPHLQRHGFVKSDAETVDAEIRDWLMSHGEAPFLAAVDTNFKNNRVRYFGVSSFGQPPVGIDKQLRKVFPLRVLDPLMWMMAEEGIIPTI